MVAITIVQTCYLIRPPGGTFDLTFDLWRVVLLGEVVLTLSLITACIPYLKPFMEALDTGAFRAGGQPSSPGHGMGYGHRATSRSRKYGPLSNLSNKSSRTQLSRVRLDNFGYGGEKDKQNGTQTTTVTTKARGRSDSDDDSQTSQ